MLGTALNEVDAKKWKVFEKSVCLLSETVCVLMLSVLGHVKWLVPSGGRQLEILVRILSGKSFSLQYFTSYIYSIAGRMKATDL